MRICWSHWLKHAASITWRRRYRLSYPSRLSEFANGPRYATRGPSGPPARIRNRTTCSLTRNLTRRVLSRGIATAKSPDYIECVLHVRLTLKGFAERNRHSGARDIVSTISVETQSPQHGDRVAQGRGGLRHHQPVAGPRRPQHHHALRSRGPGSKASGHLAGVSGRARAATRRPPDPGRERHGRVAS